MLEMFMVCWVLMHQLIPDQQNCTPPLDLAKAEVVFRFVVEAQDTKSISMELGPSQPPRPVEHLTALPEKQQ